MTESLSQSEIPIHSDEEKAWLCAANNADLYQMVFRAHGRPDRRTGTFWSSDAIAPPYYSNMTTLDPNGVADQFVEIERLTDRLGRRPSLKDGFSTLDLTGKGFRLLFTASWVWAEPCGTPACSAQGWERVRDATALNRWERAWNEAGSPSDANIFPPSLLSEPDLHIYGRSTGHSFDAGCIVNRSSQTVGVSNIFSLFDTPPAFRDAVLLAGNAFSPDLPLVGYDHGIALDELLKLGFKPVGQLRVWLPEADA